jgi:hypothetical protein
MADRQRPTPAEIVIMAAGAAMIVFSFVSFQGSTNAWGRGEFPVATLLPLYGLVMALQVALTRFAGLKLPRSVLGLTWEQVHLVVGCMAGLMAFGWLLTVQYRRGFGQWIEILGGIALVFGATMLQRERGGWTS